MTEDIAKMTGQKSGDSTPAYKLNEVRMNGDDGKFSMIQFLGEKGEDGKYKVMELGAGLDGVVLKMRWRLFKYEEGADGKAKVTSTSEFDNKLTDKVIVFSTGEIGVAAEIKEKYGLNSQRVLYVYMPTHKEIVRVIVKASALSGDKNPNGELGLFEYVDSYNDAGHFLNDFMTRISGVYRENAQNKRKSHWAMTFAQGRALNDEEKLKTLDMVKEVYSKTTGDPNFADKYAKASEEEEKIEYPADDEVSADDIPF